MIRRIFLIGTLCALAFTLFAVTRGSATDAPETLIVKMVDISPTEYAFEPAEFTAKPGDIVRFVQTSTTPHNVEFRGVPEGTSLNGDAMGPYLTTPDEVYDVLIDDRFASGTHEFVCTPHEFFGMKGVLTVAPGD